MFVPQDASPRVYGDQYADFWVDQATDVGKDFVEPLNLNVVASGAPIPTTTAPKPYASPRGFCPDISLWLKPSVQSEAGISKARMFNNIEVPGSAPGTIIAAQSFTAPNYAFNWVRDSSLTMDVVNSLYAQASKKATYEKILFDYAGARAQEQNDPNLQTGLGEPKVRNLNTASRHVRTN